MLWKQAEAIRSLSDDQRQPWHEPLRRIDIVGKGGRFEALERGGITWSCREEQ